ncbi:MAG TPA: HIT domain-containing protein [Candidatus Wallbacteria bacterium]|nr:HIT domain-containing protein [Candidatus Wallbacteria bacterium]
MHYNNLFSFNKLEYVTGKKKPDVRCILCAIAERDKRVDLLEVHRSADFLVCVNLYPFNVGHLLIFPLRHVESTKQLTKEEALQLHELTNEAMDVLSEVYSPGGFNVGYNIGACSGASIEHLHMHIVPRYSRELGFIDILGGAKLVVEHPEVTTQKLKEAFQKRKLT